MKTLIALMLCSSITLVSSIAIAKDITKARFNAGEMADGAPPELMHWGKIVGRWKTTEEALKSDGSGWEPAGTADWDMFWSYGGWGIEDHYTSPPMSESVEDETKRQRGINLRIYDPAEKKWVLTWLTTSSKSPDTYSATSNDETVVMLSEKANKQGYHHRITFFDMTDSRFEWKLERSKDQQQWLEVYRIHGVKKPA